jgi:hypothetical protein
MKPKFGFYLLLSFILVCGFWWATRTEWRLRAESEPASMQMRGSGNSCGLHDLDARVKLRAGAGDEVEDLKNEWIRFLGERGDDVGPERLGQKELIARSVERLGVTAELDELILFLKAQGFRGVGFFHTEIKNRFKGPGSAILEEFIQDSASFPDSENFQVWFNLAGVYCDKQQEVLSASPALRQQFQLGQAVQLTDGDPQGALETLSTILEQDLPTLNTYEAVTSVADKLPNESNFQQLSSYFFQNEEREWVYARSDFMGRWAGVNPADAANFAINLPEEEERNKFLGIVVQTVARQNREWVPEWLESMKSLGHYDVAAAAAVRQIYVFDREMARSLATDVSNVELRQKLLVEIETFIHREKEE